MMSCIREVPGTSAVMNLFYTEEVLSGNATAVSSPYQNISVKFARFISGGIRRRAFYQSFSRQLDDFAAGHQRRENRLLPWFKSRLWTL
jgi:hypothetical protein